MSTHATDSRRPSEVRLQDPLSKVTRTERKTLLGLSAVGIIIAKSGLVPSKISALGIEFDRADQATLLKMLSAVVLYFLVAFLVYASSDLVAWRVSYQVAVRDWRRRRELLSQPEREIEDKVTQEFLRRGQFWALAARPMSVIRGAFEFVVPILVALYAVYALVSTPPPKAQPRAQSSSVVSAAAQPNNTLHRTGARDARSGW